MVMAFRKIQIGKEATRGTKVAATKVLLGRLTVTPKLGLYMPEDEDRNSLAAVHRRTIQSQDLDWSFDGSLSYDQIIYFLAMNLKGAVTPTTPGGGVTSRDWTFTPALAAVNTHDTYTVEHGDNTQEYEFGFGVGTGLELTYALGEVVALSATGIGQFHAKSSFTGALAAPTNFDDVVAQKTKLYLDTTWAGLGTTQQLALINAVVRLPPAIQPNRVADGALDFSHLNEIKRAAEVELTFRHIAAGVTEYDRWVSGGQVFARLESTGPLIEGALNKLFRVDLALRYTGEPEMLAESNGENVIRLTARTFPDVTSGNDMSVMARNVETTLG